MHALHALRFCYLKASITCMIRASEPQRSPSSFPEKPKSIPTLVTLSHIFRYLLHMLTISRCGPSLKKSTNEAALSFRPSGGRSTCEERRSSSGTVGRSWKSSLGRRLTSPHSSIELRSTPRRIFPFGIRFGANCEGSKLARSLHRCERLRPCLSQAAMRAGAAGAEHQEAGPGHRGPNLPRRIWVRAKPQRVRRAACSGGPWKRPRPGSRELRESGAPGHLSLIVSGVMGVKSSSREGFLGRNFRKGSTPTATRPMIPPMVGAPWYGPLRLKTFVSVRNRTDFWAEFPAASIAETVTACSPSTRRNTCSFAMPTESDGPPSKLTSNPVTPDSASVAFHAIVTRESETKSDVGLITMAGPVRSTGIVMDLTASSFPAASTDR